MTVKFKITLLIMFLFTLPLLSASTVQKGMAVLMYHAVDDKVYGDCNMFVSTEEFYKQMKYLHDNGYSALQFSELTNWHKYNKPIMITFDDGYSDTYNAYQVLKQFHLKATIFLVCGFIGKPGYLNVNQIDEMSDIVSFQSHTLTHSNLSVLDTETIKNECLNSKILIEKLTGKPVNTLAYPYGLFNKRVAAIASNYYDYCVTTDGGIYNDIGDKHTIKRLYVVYSDTIKDFVRKLK